MISKWGLATASPMPCLRGVSQALRGIDFLAESGVLDREKFKEFLLRHLEEYVDTVTQVYAERDD